MALSVLIQNRCTRMIHTILQNVTNTFSLAGPPYYLHIASFASHHQICGDYYFVSISLLWSSFPLPSSCRVAQRSPGKKKIKGKTKTIEVGLCKYCHESILHSIEIKGLFLMKFPSKMLQNLFHFPNELCDSLGKKVAWNGNLRKICVVLKFWSVLLGDFIKHIFLISEEWLPK